MDGVAASEKQHDPVDINDPLPLELVVLDGQGRLDRPSRRHVRSHATKAVHRAKSENNKV